jgi:hypothetical protein
MYDDLSGLTPEEIQQLIGLSTLDEQGSQLEQQLAQAQALRQPGQSYGTPIAAGLGGIADVINAYKSSKQTKAIRGEQAKLMKQKTDGRNVMAEALMRRGNQQARPGMGIQSSSPSLLQGQGLQMDPFMFGPGTSKNPWNGFNT